MRPFVLASLLFLCAELASAHTQTTTTIPAEGAIVAEAPASLILEFAKPIRLVIVRATYMDHPSAEVGLDDQEGFATRFELPFPVQGKGAYRVEWRGIAVDGHIMQDAFSFRVE